MEEITLGRHWGRQTGRNGARKNPGAPAAQGLRVGRHWVDTGERRRRAQALAEERSSAGSEGLSILHKRMQNFC